MFLFYHNITQCMHHVGVISDIFSFFCYMMMGRKNLSYLFYHNSQNSKIQCILGGSGPPVSKRRCMEETHTLRPLKKLRSEQVGMIRAPKKPEVYLWVKRNYSFWVWMVGLIETLVLEMVKQREAEERMTAALERLMRWVEEMEMEKSWRSWRLEKRRNKMEE